MAFVNERTEDGQWQTIDHERGVVLRCLGGGRPQEPTDFEVMVDDVPIRFSALQRLETRKDIKKFHVEWDIWRIFIPPEISEGKERLFKIIEESLGGFGSASSTENVASFNVNFPSNIIGAP